MIAIDDGVPSRMSEASSDEEEEEEEDDGFREPSFFESILEKHWRIFSTKPNRIKKSQAVELMMAVARDLNFPVSADLRAEFKVAASARSDWPKVSKEVLTDLFVGVLPLTHRHVDRNFLLDTGKETYNLGVAEMVTFLENVAKTRLTTSTSLYLALLPSELLLLVSTVYKEQKPTPMEAKPKWTYNAHILHSKMRLLANVILCPSSKGPYAVTALDKDTGQVVWRSHPKAGQKPVNDVCITRDGLLCVSTSRYVLAYKPPSCRRLWEVILPDEVCGLAAFEDSLVVVCVDKHRPCSIYSLLANSDDCRQPYRYTKVGVLPVSMQNCEVTVNRVPGLGRVAACLCAKSLCVIALLDAMPFVARQIQHRYASSEHLRDIRSVALCGSNVLLADSYEAHRISLHDLAKITDKDAFPTLNFNGPAPQHTRSYVHLRPFNDGGGVIALQYFSASFRDEANTSHCLRGLVLNHLYEQVLEIETKSIVVPGSRCAFCLHQNMLVIVNRGEITGIDAWTGKVVLSWVSSEKMNRDVWPSREALDEASSRWLTFAGTTGDRLITASQTLLTAWSLSPKDL